MGIKNSTLVHWALPSISRPSHKYPALTPQHSWVNVTVAPFYNEVCRGSPTCPRFLCWEAAKLGCKPVKWVVLREDRALSGQQGQCSRRNNGLQLSSHVVLTPPFPVPQRQDLGRVTHILTPCPRVPPHSTASSEESSARQSWDGCGHPHFTCVLMRLMIA